METEVERMDEIVVAKPTTTMVVLSALGSALILGPLALLVALRVAMMKVSVTPSSVVIVNFLNRSELPLEEAKIVRERDQAPFLSDSGGKMDSTGRVLYVTDDTGRKVRVGMAPYVGDQFDSIAEDLQQAISTMKAAS